MSRNTNRPLSPHLTIWRWGPHMLVSILHRITGVGLSIAGLGLLTWWLAAIAGGPDAFADFAGVIDWKLKLGAIAIPLVKLILIALSWAFFQHALSGIRHLVMDIGAGFELGANKSLAMATMAGSLLLTAALWAYLLVVRA